MVLDPQSKWGILLYMTQLDIAREYSPGLDTCLYLTLAMQHRKAVCTRPVLMKHQRMLIPAAGAVLPTSSSRQGLCLSLLFMSDYSKQWSALRDSRLSTPPRRPPRSTSSWWPSQGQQVWLNISFPGFTKLKLKKKTHSNPWSHWPQVDSAKRKKKCI